jgi:hypothetical protein
MTRSVCHAAAATLDLLTDGLEIGDRIEVRDRDGVHMALHVERLPAGPAGPLFVFAHRPVGREPVPDPEVVLLRAAVGRWTPLSITLPSSHLVTASTDGAVVAERRDEHRRLVKLVDLWMRIVSANLLRTHHLLQEEEVCSPAEYQPA